jgi:hypothetical protein
MQQTIHFFAFSVSYIFFQNNHECISSPEQSSSEEDHSDGYVSFVSFNFFVCFYLEVNPLCCICHLTSEYLQRFKGGFP